MRPRRRLRTGRQLALSALVALGITAAGAGLARDAAKATHPAEPTAPLAEVAAPPDPGTRNGRDIYRSFRDGLADAGCAPEVSARWSRHYAAAPRRLARRDDTLALFGYVVDAVREAHLPTEYALIPFVESGYRPGARSALGPAGMWQLIKVTARAHEVPIRDGFDGRLSPVESTRAAVRYLKTLHGMFAGDWRLAAMAYNAGEYRVFRALEQGGQIARAAQPEKLPGLPELTHAYVRKLQALSCLMQEAGAREEWRAALDRPVPWLQAVPLPPGAERIDAWAQRTGRDGDRLSKLNPAFAGGRIPSFGGQPLQVLAVAQPPVGVVATGADTVTAAATLVATADAAPATPRRHTVEPGDSLWALARRYGVSVRALRQRNGIDADNVLHPGTVLLIDAGSL
jgi:membrane-bound lytic murein transglycosylase D